MKLYDVSVQQVIIDLNAANFVVLRRRSTPDGNGIRLDLDNGAIVIAYYSGTVVFQGRYPHPVYRALKEALASRRGRAVRKASPRRANITSERQLLQWLVGQVSGIRPDDHVAVPGVFGKIVARLIANGEVVVARRKRPALVHGAIMDAHKGLCRSKPKVAAFVAEAVSVIVAEATLTISHAVEILVRLVDSDQTKILQRTKAGRLRWVSTPTFERQYGFSIDAPGA